MVKDVDLDRFFGWYMLGILAVWLVVGKARVIALYARGVHVIVVDWHKPIAVMVGDTLSLACLLYWFYEAVAHAWPLKGHTDPWVLGTVLLAGAAVKVIGAALLLWGVILYSVALLGLGASWRLGIDRKTPGPLVTTGIYGWCRHPIYAALGLLFMGTFLVLERLVFLLLLFAMGAVLHLGARAEERFLTSVHGDAYRDYCRHVGRYFTWRRTS
jgi:protein-S-isoprenylcysteine O-methyltransferase Ste14